MELTGKNIVVLDLETAASANDCCHCGQTEALHHGVPQPLDSPRTGTIPPRCEAFEKIGWQNKVALGLSIGCYFGYQDTRLSWFDAQTVGTAVQTFLNNKPLLVSFNGIQFDFAVMRALLRHAPDPGVAVAMQQVCDEFKALCATSYDILAEIWKIDPVRKVTRGLNSLDAICRATGLPAKEMDGAMAPRLWQQGRYAEVIAYNVGDVLRTKRLFELICTGQPIYRGDGQPITLPLPTLPGEEG